MCKCCCVLHFAFFLSGACRDKKNNQTKDNHYEPYPEAVPLQRSHSSQVFVPLFY